MPVIKDHPRVRDDSVGSVSLKVIKLSMAQSATCRGPVLASDSESSCLQRIKGHGKLVLYFKFTQADNLK